jgi:hypothetical protein
MRRALAFCLLLTACSGQGQIVLGLATDLPARGEIDQVTLDVHHRGETASILQFSWNLSGLPTKDYRLPGSFSLYADDGTQPTFDVVVHGLLGGSTRVERHASLGILPDQDLFVRLGLTASCETLGCPPSLTCVEGACRSPFINVHALPKYASQLVDHLACDSGTAYADTSTGMMMPVLGGCGAGQHCVEGTCLVDASGLPGADPKAFTGGIGELFYGGGIPAFFSIAPVDAPRFFGTATALDDGRVLVVGGFDRPALDGSTTAVPGAVIYEPLSASFRRIADPPLAMGGHTATKLEGGTVLLVGTSGGAPAAMIFDPAIDDFGSAPAPKLARSFHTATVLVDKRVLVFGGASTLGGTPATTAEIYDPIARTWSDSNGAPLHPRAFHTTVTLPDFRVLEIGGLDATGTPIADVEAYDPTSGTFSAEAKLARPRALHTATLLSDGNILVVGGESEPNSPANADAELYVVGGMVAPSPPSPPPFPRLLSTAVLLDSDRVLYTGGATQASSAGLAAAGGAYLYDHASRSFSLIAPPHLGRIGAFAATLGTGEVLLGGGVSADTSVSDGGMSVDMTPSICDPVAQPGANGCPASAPRCTVAGEARFGPALQTDVGPRCVAALAAPVLLGGTCMSGDHSGKDDNCVDATACLVELALTTDLGSATACQRLCHTDADCTDPQRARCAHVFGGPNTTDIGVCLQGCTIDLGGECQMFPGTSCRFAPNRPSVGAPLQAAGFCLADGMQTVTQPCDQLTVATACSSGNLCQSGMCSLLCSPDIPCTGTSCMRLVATDPLVNGYCP